MNHTIRPSRFSPPQSQESGQPGVSGQFVLTAQPSPRGSGLGSGGVRVKGHPSHGVLTAVRAWRWERKNAAVSFFNME